MNKLTKTNYTMRPEYNINSFTDFKQIVGDNNTLFLKGIIESVVLRDDTVFAIVRRNHGDLNKAAFREMTEYTHGEYGYFNLDDGLDPDGYTIAELAIPTDITPVGIPLERYLNKDVLVKEVDGIAVFASIAPNPEPLISIPISKIKRVREMLRMTDEDDIFSDVANKFWGFLDVTQDQVKALKGMIYKPEDQADKMITVEGEGVWFKDTDSIEDKEAAIEANLLMLGLNKSGMKSRDCHQPVRIFSAK